MITIIVQTYDSPTRTTIAQATYYSKFRDVRLIIIDGGHKDYSQDIAYNSDRKAEYHYLPNLQYSDRVIYSKSLIKDEDYVIMLNDDEFYVVSTLIKAYRLLKQTDYKFATGIPYSFKLGDGQQDAALYEWQPPYFKHRKYHNDGDTPDRRIKYQAESYLPVYYYSLMKGFSWKKFTEIISEDQFLDNSFDYVREIHCCLIGSCIGKSYIIQEPMLLRNLDPQKDAVSWHEMIYCNDYRDKSLSILEYSLTKAKEISDSSITPRLIVEYYLSLAEKSYRLHNISNSYLEYVDFDRNALDWKAIFQGNMGIEKRVGSDVLEDLRLIYQTLMKFPSDR